jgi:hypothetical protein
MAKSKQVQVTSVTPNSKVDAVPKAQQERTRKLVAAALEMTAAGKAAKLAGAGVKAVRVAKAAKENKKGFAAVTKMVIKQQTDQVAAGSVKVKNPRDLGYITPSKEFTPINIAAAKRAKDARIAAAAKKGKK